MTADQIQTQAQTQPGPRLTSLSPGAGCAVLLHDAQTSGGLLLATPPAAAPVLLSDLRAQGLPAALIGEVIQGESGHVHVHQVRSA